MRKQILLQWVWIAFLAVSPAYARELTILAVEEPPGSFIGDNGEPDGFAIDVVREIQRRTGNRDDISIVPEVRTLLCKKECANKVLVGFSRTPGREKKFRWITLLFRKPWVLYARKNFDGSVKDLEDAKKAGAIGVVRGDIRAEYLKQLDFKNAIEVSSHEQGLKMLLRDRIQLFFYEPQGIFILLKKMGFPPAVLKGVLETRFSEVYIMMPLPTPAKTAKEWRKAADGIKRDGTFDLIVTKWAVIFDQFGINYRYDNGVLDFKP